MSALKSLLLLMFISIASPAAFSFWASGSPQSTVSDCAVVKMDTGEAKWWVADCGEVNSVMCFSGSRWYKSSAKTALTDYAAAQEICENEFGKGVYFSAPNNVSEVQSLTEVLTYPYRDIRYVRDHMGTRAGYNGEYGYWAEVEAYSAGVNVAEGKPVTGYNASGVAYTGIDATSPDIFQGDLEEVTNGDHAYYSSPTVFWLAFDPPLNVGDPANYVQIDLGQIYTVDSIVSYHWWNRWYEGTKVEVSDDGVTWFTAFDSAVSGIYEDTYLGHTALLTSGEPENVWVNGNRLADQVTWQWNVYDTNIPKWDSQNGQPDGGESENCAFMNNSGNGNWEDGDCTLSLPYICYNTVTTTWHKSPVWGDLTNAANGHATCEATTNWVFKSPTNYGENLAAAAIMGANPRAWLNATDANKESEWALNVGYTSTFPNNWAAGQPDNGGLDFSAETALIKGEDCVYQDGNMQLHDIDCQTSTPISWACSAGPSEWRVTEMQSGVVQADVASQFANGHRSCFEEFGDSWLFIAPSTEAEAALLAQAMVVADNNSSALIDKVWINMTDGVYEDEGRNGGVGTNFKSNLPYTHWDGLMPGVNPVTDCAFKNTSPYGTASPWQTDGCVTSAAHYACYNGANWEIAVANGELVGGELQVVPQSGVDIWSYERGHNLCALQFGPSYYFSAPLSAQEDTALDNSIRKLDAAVKKTWINYYQVTRITPQYNDWFNNRITASIWADMGLENTNNQDCMVAYSDGSWSDQTCENKKVIPPEPDRAYACLNGSDGAWQVLGGATKGSWDKGFAICDAQAGAIYATPRSAQEKDALTAAIALSGEPGVWVNYTDTAIEQQWIANRLRFAWWADNEPTSDGNKDCAMIDEVGEWYAKRCDFEVARFACNDNGVWKITGRKARFSEGFSFCANEFEESSFDVPAHRGVMAGGTENNALMGVIANAIVAGDLEANEKVWINYSDQAIENAWHKVTVYTEWGTDSVLDEGSDCAFFDRTKAGSGTWQARECRYIAGAGEEQGYACTNGYEWRIVPSAAGDQIWSQGFAACNTLDTATDDWTYAAPTTAYENSKLKLALVIAGINRAWINAHDRFDEGDWLVNSIERNFPATIDTSETALEVPETTNGLLLTAKILDDENLGIETAVWTLISDSRYTDVTNSSVYASLSATNLVNPTGEAIATATYNTPAALQEDILLVFKITVKDIPGGTLLPEFSEATVQIRIESSIIAWYDFNDLSFLGKDRTGNEHDAVDTPSEPLPPVVDGALQMDGTETMKVLGLGELAPWKVRYIRDYVGVSDANDGVHWTEIEAVELGTGINVALASNGATITGADSNNYDDFANPSSQPLTQIIDGNVVTTGNFTSLGSALSGRKHVTIDLNAYVALESINIRHYYNAAENGGVGRTYQETQTAVSADGIHWVTVFDSATSGTYEEEEAGRTINVTALENPISAPNNNFRYIRDYLGKSDAGNDATHWVEIQAFENGTGTNVALGADVKGYDHNNNEITGSTQPVTAVTDGNIDTSIDPVNWTSLGSGDPDRKHIIVDLGGQFTIDSINVRHYYFGAVREYEGTETQVSADGITWFNVFDSAVEGTYPETSTGHVIDTSTLNIPVGPAPDNRIRYIRDHQNGTNVGTGRHWVEIEAYAGSTNVASKLNNSNVSWFGQHSDTGRAVAITHGTPDELGDEIINTAYYINVCEEGDYRSCSATVDLGGLYDISRINIRHYYGDGRAVLANKVEVSADGVNWVTVLTRANEPEIAAGKDIFLSGVLVPQNTPVYKKWRYIRDHMNGSSNNPYNHWVEIQAYDAITGENVALGKTSTLVQGTYSAGDINILTDGLTGNSPQYAANPGASIVQVDLGQPYNLGNVNVYHYYDNVRDYKFTKTEVSEDGVTWYTIFDSAAPGSSTFVPTAAGHLIPALIPERSYQGEEIFVGVLSSSPPSYLNTNGLILPTNEFTVAFRVRLQEGFEVANAKRGLLQKGTAGKAHPAIFLTGTSNNLNFSNSTTNNANNESFSTGLTETKQWVNVAYIKHADKLEYYIDGVITDTHLLGAGEFSVNNNSDLTIGSVPDAPLGFVGEIDDIQIYNRVLTAAEVESVLPLPPEGILNFSTGLIVIDEDAASVNVTVTRTEGSTGAVSAYIKRDDAATSTFAIEGSVITASDIPDYDLSDANYGASGQQVTWADGDKSSKSITIALDSLDDDIVEGSEFIAFDLDSIMGVYTNADIGGVDATADEVLSMLYIGDNRNSIIKLVDVTPNPFGNFKITSSWSAPLLESAVDQTACIARESGATGVVTVNYTITGDALEGTDDGVNNYQFAASDINPAGNSGSVTFVDGDATNKCFLIEVHNHETNYGESDKTMNITITSLTHAPTYDFGSGPVPMSPLLSSAENMVTMVIQDDSPGTFKFDVSSLVCLEPNYFDKVSAAKKPPTNPTVCTTTITRENAAGGAPVGQLFLSAAYDTASIADLVSVTSAPVFPAIARGSSAPSPDEQEITFVVRHDNEYEDADGATVNIADPEQVTFTLTGQNLGARPERIDNANDTLTLNIIDVTSPAVITTGIDSNLTSVNEGEPVTFNIVRNNNASLLNGDASERSGTAFDIAYSYYVLGGLTVPTASDFVTPPAYVVGLAGAYEQGSGTISFTPNSGSESDMQQITITPATIVGGPSLRTVELLLENPEPEWLVAFSSLTGIDNANKSLTQTVDVTSRESLLNTIDLPVISVDGVPITDNLNLPFETTVHDPNAGDDVASVRFKNLSVSFGHRLKDAVGGNDDYSHQFIEYEWTLDNLQVPMSGGTPTELGLYQFFTPNLTSTLVSRSGSQDLTLGAASLTTTMQLPFVLIHQTVELKLTINSYSGNSNASPLSESLTLVYPLTLTPTWRQVLSGTGNCLGYGNWTTCGSDETKLSWHPTEYMIYHKKPIDNGWPNLCTWGANSYVCHKDDSDLSVEIAGWGDVFSSGNGLRDDSGNEICNAGGSTASRSCGAGQTVAERNSQWSY